MEIAIYNATLNDINEISKLFDSYRVFYGQKSDIKIAKQFLTERISNSESVIFYARGFGEKYLGFTQLFPSFSSVSARKLWILNDLFVDPNFRSEGIGYKLLSAAKKFSFESGAKGLMLETEETNAGAQKLYERFGFERDTNHFVYYLNTQL